MGLLGPRARVGGEPHGVLRPLGPAKLSVRERGEDLGNDGGPFARLHADRILRRGSRIAAGQALSEGVLTIVLMSGIIDLIEWRRAREDAAAASAPASDAAEPDPAVVARLD